MEISRSPQQGTRTGIIENGVLTVVIPKKDAVPERETGRIEIQ